MTERVLVTGITGYIGQHCGAELLRQGYEVVGTVRSKSKAESTRSALGARSRRLDRSLWRLGRNQRLGRATADCCVD
ncbi:MAG: NAD-dependent epimerase/dehydratase family protein [Ilumatobacter sp.]|jgi:uncharacterized protein YbjT (DUF2867 family)|uniref:GDP-mannose 4,6-dehydratase n=1 Tax=Ilumatobacter sp. TaxID=1967498 RepID=UPI001DEEB5DD|nr:NAD-dependent epimerase/dehydratase family protein [Ilumatobacter sp.]MBT5275239.1 NAD-dependent epimerase/dehydratase family protein [Ilumatobacter sp.]MBT5552265.1 NAD-dependent epimerase/dehydratase family protein [Ilumatobacter sp.]MBT5864772.1 NAD-dependent epimerase/dehydratase family protein [Ilumatobacter sp.]MDG0976546.1 GDP-mannose 4,6-dehydratase [Ilumatobacter sp.]